MQRRYDSSNIPIELLRSFVIIQETGSFTKAADLLRLTQPAISAQVKRLQQLVGGEVFLRTTFGVSLTEKGEIVSRYARRILTMNDQILALAGPNAVSQALRIGLPSIFGASMMGALLADLKSAVSDRIVITCELSADLARNLASGYLDIAFLLSQGMSSIKAFSTWPEPMVWVCAEDFTLAPGAPVPLLNWPNSLAQFTAVDAMDNAGLQYVITFSSSDYASHLSALRAGLGYLVLPERIVPADLKIAQAPFLAALPPCVGGIYIRDGLESQIAMAVAQAMNGVMRGSDAAPAGNRSANRASH